VLAPSERVFAGKAPPSSADGAPRTVPYVAVERSADAAQVRTSSRRGLSLEVLRMRMVADSLETALAIAEAARLRFTGFGCELPGGAIQDMRVASQEHGPADQGLWQATLEWRVRVSRDPPRL
jgi:hypothetical protein